MSIIGPQTTLLMLVIMLVIESMPYIPIIGCGYFFEGKKKPADAGFSLLFLR